MSLIKCKKCGEMFSDSYKTCPFCEEDDAYYGGRATKRRRRAETPRRKAPSILGPVVVLVLILLVLLVVWLLFGDQIKTAIGGQKPPVEDVIPEPTPTPDPDPVEPADTITLNRAVLALDVGGKETLKVNEETTETCAWSSSDPAVVTVSDTGEVTAVAAGSAVITAKVGSAEATCSVTVKAAEGSDTTGSTGGSTTGSTTGNTTATVDVSKLTITATSEGGYEGDLASAGETGVFEMSAKAGEVWTLGLKGTDASVTWAMDGDSNGVCKLEGAKVTVTGTSSGRYATIVGTVGGGTVKAIIRIR
ncbi:MAG: Ig domain-containing protein [Oscillospiraceae bacterium]